MGTFARVTGYLVVLATAPSMAAPPRIGGDFEYNAEGRVERAGGGRSLAWDTTGRVSALDRAGAAAKANAAIDTFLKEYYPGFSEVSETRNVRVRQVVDVAVGPNHTTLRLSVSCLAYVKQEKAVLTILAWDVVTEPVVTDKFDLRVIVTREDEDQRFESEIRTLGHGKPGEMFRWFDLWAGDFVDGDPPLEFTVRVLHKNLPNLERFAPPPQPNPADPNDGFTEVGAFHVRLGHIPYAAISETSSNC